MRNKKSAQADGSPEEEAVVKRVDRMLSTELPEEKSADAAGQPPAEKTLKITPTQPEGASTAPAIPESLLKQIKADDDAEAPKPPLKIDSSTAQAAEASKPGKADTMPVEAADQEAEPPVNSVETGPQSVELGDRQTDQAVDEIVAREGDTVLALEDAKNRRSQPSSTPGFKDKIKAFFKNKWTWLGLLLVLIVLLGVPATRYRLLGLAIKKSVAVTVIDSKTNTAVSRAEISIAGGAAQTDADGKAVVRARLGSQIMTTQKQYYKTQKQSYFVGFSAAKPLTVRLTATGRLVPVTVVNKISGKPLAGAEIKVLKTTVKTNAQGRASIALPASKQTQAAAVSLNGYNSAQVTLHITDQTVAENTFRLTPAGRVYFLSNASGSLDVVKTNLDGSGRKVVLAGTGREQPGATTLLASRDWRYIVLKARRDNHEALYLIDTSNDKVTAFDTSNVTFVPLGWYGHSFMYELIRSDQPAWQSGSQALKAYDADRQQLNQLDQSQAEGDQTAYAYQELANFYVVNNAVVYTTQWFSGGTSYDIGGKSSTIRAVQPSGQNKKDYQSFKATNITTMQAALYKPRNIYFAVHDASLAKTLGYEYSDQTVASVPLESADLGRGYPTYLLSPSGVRTFWTELRDGRNVLLSGDANAGGARQITGVSGFTPYGWFTDKYVLASKNNSELYVMPANGPGPKLQPLKVADYYKPAQSFPGYGYGYGGF